jgi:hypothetical protein
MSGELCITRWVNRYPYGVLYESASTRLLVLAVMHLRREPGYWVARRSE